MGQRENVVRTNLWAKQLSICGQAAVDKVVMQQAEFIHREAMFGWKRRAVIFMVDERQGHSAYVLGSKGNLASNGCLGTAI